MTRSDYQRQWRAENHDYKVAWNREWRHRNKEKVAAQAARRLARAQAWWDEVRSSLVCVDCGSTTNLDFHHRDPERKTASVSALIRYSRAKVVQEMEKCDVLCRSCHKLRHYAAKRARAA